MGSNEASLGTLLPRSEGILTLDRGAISTPEPTAARRVGGPPYGAADQMPQTGTYGKYRGSHIIASTAGPSSSSSR